MTQEFSRSAREAFESFRLISDLMSEVEKSRKLNDKQLKRYQALEARRSEVILTAFEKALTQLEAVVGQSAAEAPPKPEPREETVRDETTVIINLRELERWGTEQNVEDLARILMSEGSMANPAEKMALAFTVLYRMKRNQRSQVREVWGSYVKDADPTPMLGYARKVFAGEIPDQSGGATHFYSPVAMPHEGDPTEGIDVHGGLEQTAGLDTKNYKPGWANLFEAVPIDGVREMRYRFYRQPGNGRVY